MCVSVLKGHQGKHVWKCMLCELAGGGMVVATGGNDSDTKIWDGGAPGAGGAEGGGGATGCTYGVCHLLLAQKGRGS